MGTFTSSKMYTAGQELIPIACREIKKSFEADGFEYAVKSESYNKTVVTVTKGNLFKQAVGLKQGLEISFTSSNGSVSVEAKGTVLKDQAIASAITLLVAWPVLIPQIIGMINQSKLDEKVLEAVDKAYNECRTATKVFCPNCGHEVVNGVCPNCGTRA